jgi:hypothetical protein
MSFGVNEGNGCPFSTLGIAVMLVIGGVLMLVQECSAAIGMPW